MHYSDMSALNIDCLLLFMYHAFLTLESFQVDLPRTVNSLESVYSICSCVLFFFLVYFIENALLSFLNLTFFISSTGFQYFYFALLSLMQWQTELLGRAMRMKTTTLTLGSSLLALKISM